MNWCCSISIVKGCHARIPLRAGRCFRSDFCFVSRRANQTFCLADPASLSRMASQDENQAQHNKGSKIIKISEYLLLVLNVCVRCEANTLQRNSTHTVPAFSWRPIMALSFSLSQRQFDFSKCCSKLKAHCCCSDFPWRDILWPLLIAIHSVSHSVWLCTSRISFHLLFWTLLTCISKRWPSRILLWMELERLSHDRMLMDNSQQQHRACCTGALLSGKTQISGV